MPERSGYPDGEPCWADVTVPDLDAAERFYGAVLGWTFQRSGPEFGDYTMAFRDGRKVAGLTPPPPGGAFPPAWSLYLASSDVDATAGRLEAAGGKLLTGPLDVPGSGRMLYGFDATGAAFGVWQGAEHTGADLVEEPGAPAWAELNSREGAAADAFYRALFDYEQEQVGDGEAFDYTIWNLGGRAVCGRLRMGEEFPAGMPPHWMVYFAVADTDAAARRVATAGGDVAVEPFDSPYGRIAVARDTGGAVFSVIDLATRSTAPPPAA
jgi:hypothetical protein